MASFSNSFHLQELTLFIKGVHVASFEVNLNAAILSLEAAVSNQDIKKGETTVLATEKNQGNIALNPLLYSNCIMW